jgi:hypothetical protein
MGPSGGVCAVLDYEIDQKSEYVAMRAQQLVLPGTLVSPSFRKFVSGILSSTRLPSTTILLGMTYLSKRIGGMRVAGNYKVNDGTCWRMLTIALLLGSKFLDDNTFQNKSWSEVSGISTVELNQLESKWLEDENYNMYVNIDSNEPYLQWLKDWQIWRKEKNAQRKSTLDRLAPLAPIDTNVQRVRPYSQAQKHVSYQKSASPERPLSDYRSPYDHNQNWMQTSYPTPHTTPPSAPDSGVTTPEYLSATGGTNTWGLYSNQYPRIYQSSFASYLPPKFAPFQTPYIQHGHPHPFGVEMYGAVTPPCVCVHCLSVPKPFGAWGHGYGQQIAA